MSAQSLALDLHLVRGALGWITRLAKTTRDLRHLADGLGGQLYAELDYVGEAANAVAFRAAHQSLPYLQIPRTLPQLCTQRVLVLEWVSGVPPSQVGSCCLPRVGVGSLGKCLNTRERLWRAQ
jgi:predicted unusual protein kinase regulating ubiquinone biosynthesis (AarF/ABC1/UbiB family)